MADKMDEKMADKMADKMDDKMADKMAERRGVISGRISNPIRYYWINLGGITLGALALLTGYGIIFYVQSSLYSKEGLGTTALAVDYASQMISCFFLPPFLVKTIGCKWSLVTSAVCIAVYILANLHGSFSTLIPASVFVGVGYATMWVVRNIIVSDLAAGYARDTGKSLAVCLSRFFVIFYAIINTAGIWGNVISSQILSSQGKNNQSDDSFSHLTCGAQFCSTDQQESKSCCVLCSHGAKLKNTNDSMLKYHRAQVPQSEINNLVIAALSIDVLGAVLVLVFLSSYKATVRDVTESNWDRLLATIRFHRNPNMLLLVVCTISPGLMISFFSADFTEAFVTCSVGINNVGLVASSFGIATAVGTALLYIGTFVPRPVLFIGALLLNIADLFIMLFWTPDPNARAMFYVIAAIWGATFAVWMSQLLALYGDVFAENHQEAYTCARFWDCVGFVIGFTWSYYLCMYVKIYIIMAFLLTGTFGYVLVEIRHRRAKCITYQAILTN